MSEAVESRAEARQQPRLRVPAMYTLLRVRRRGERRYRWTGYIYDISVAGMRFELDEPLEPGTVVEVRGMLPGQHHTTFRAVGRVVRLHTEDEAVGPHRMGMNFDEFAHDGDRHRLDNYLRDSGLRRAA